MDQLRRGTTIAAILKVVETEPMYAYRIIQILEGRSRGLIPFPEGLIYPTLHRLEQDGFLESQWRTEEGRRRKYYAITADGRRRLTEEEAALRSFTTGVLRLLGDGVDA